MMGSGVMGGWGWGMMLGGGLAWLLVLIVIILGVVALARYVFPGRRD